MSTTNEVPVPFGLKANETFSYRIVYRDGKPVAVTYVREDGSKIEMRPSTTTTLTTWALNKAGFNKA